MRYIQMLVCGFLKLWLEVSEIGYNYETGNGHLQECGKHGSACPCPHAMRVLNSVDIVKQHGQNSDQMFDLMFQVEQMVCLNFVLVEAVGLKPVVTNSARDTEHPALEIHSTTPAWHEAEYNCQLVLGHQAAWRDRGPDSGPPRLPSSHKAQLERLGRGTQTASPPCPPADT